MEISDVLTALEELKNGIAAVKSANENVERAATAARKVCEAFGACSSELEAFPANVMDPIRGKVSEIAEASKQMVRSYAESVEELRNETKRISEAIRSTIDNSCDRIQKDVDEFHREIETFESKLSRMANRVEEKTDGIALEVKKIAESTHGDMESLAAVQSANLETLSSRIGTSEASVKEEDAARADGLDKAVAGEFGKTRDRLENARQAVLGEIGSIRKIAWATAILSFAAAACAALLAVKAYGA